MSGVEGALGVNAAGAVLRPGPSAGGHHQASWEGIRIPPLKLREAGVMNDTLVKVLRLNVRIPDTFMGDINAQIAGCQIGGRRLNERGSCS